MGLLYLLVLTNNIRRHLIVSLQNNQQMHRGSSMIYSNLFAPTYFSKLLNQHPYVKMSPTDCGASLCVIKKPRGRGGSSQRWAIEPEKIMKIKYVECISLAWIKDEWRNVVKMVINLQLPQIAGNFCTSWATSHTEVGL
jgi:hypothetical protein